MSGNGRNRTSVVSAHETVAGTDVAAVVMLSASAGQTGVMYAYSRSLRPTVIAADAAADDDDDEEEDEDARRNDAN